MEKLTSPVDFLYFARRFLHENAPCLFDQGLTSSWKARALWQRDGNPDLEYLEKEFGHAIVPVADCNEIIFSSHSKTLWKLSEYLSYWKGLMSEHMTEDRLLYLKDWHFTKDFPSYDAYSVPDVFQSDWLNEVWDKLSLGGEGRDDYRFVYMGPKGTWTPFHADVFRSYSWSVNVCGRKEWLLYPPGQEEHLCDKYGHLPLDITSQELYNDKSLYPNIDKANPPLSITQEEGEAIFIPSGWYHQVRNLEDTISINHNWTNAFGIRHVWEYLNTELLLIEKEIDDCRSMEGWKDQCQLILKSEAGMDFVDFYKFLSTVAEPRLKQLSEVVNSASIESLKNDTIIKQLNCTTDKLLHILSYQNHNNDDFTFLVTQVSSDLKSLTLTICELLNSKTLQVLLLLRVFELQSICTLLQELELKCIESDFVYLRTEIIIEILFKHNRLC